MLYKIVYIMAISKRNGNNLSVHPTVENKEQILCKHRPDSAQFSNVGLQGNPKFILKFLGHKLYVL